MKTTEGSVVTTESPTLVVSSAWNDRIGGFATVVGKSPEVITEALKALVGEPGPDALAALSDPTAVLDIDLQGVLVSAGPAIPLGIFRKNLPKLRGPQVVLTPSASSESAPGTAFDAVLPVVPEDSSFLELLKVGGVLKPAATEVLSAIKAALASRLGVYSLPDLIVLKMEEFAEAQEEPVGEAFFELRNLVIKRSYGEVLSVLGVEGSFVSEKRKTAFLARVDDNLWREVQSFYDQIVAWQNSWMSGASNPGMALTMLAMASTGGRGSVMPPGMMQPPETAGIRDAAESVINSINRVFAGVGIPIARALAYDATRIKAVLERPGLPAALGAANREQMLKMLGVTVGADYVRLERNLARFVLGVMKLPEVPSGNDEYLYLGALLQLGNAIPWDKLHDVVPTRASIGSGRANGRERGGL
jgi:hypothetical protein